MDSFYRAFEDRHRGSRELIKSRLAKYAPFIDPLAALYPGAKTFDLGCGRGEWLELMGDAGFAPQGVDLDDDMLEACRERGLPASQGDAIEHLATLESNSHAVISAFHVVEHVSFEQLGRIVSEALRVLKPGGLLILETPNPENIAVATCNFYIDPSHQKPIPPLLLSFVAEYAGFDRVKVVRLQEPGVFADAATQIHFLDVVRGASPDYAIVAQKDAASTQGAFDVAFDTDYGLTIDALAQRYEERLASGFSQLEARIQKMDDRIQMIEHQGQGVEDRLQSTEEQFRRAEERHVHDEDRYRYAEDRFRHAEEQRKQAEAQLLDMMNRIQHAEAMAHQANAVLHSVYTSTSWRVTAPMRWVRLLLGSNRAAFVKSRLKPVLNRGAQYVIARPTLHRIALRVLNRVPGLKLRLRNAVVETLTRVPEEMPVPEVLGTQALRIHADLVAAIKQREQERH